MPIERIILCSFAVVRMMIMIASLGIPLVCVDLIKKSESDWLKMALAQIGMFFDCPVCASVVAAALIVLFEAIGLLFVNTILGLSVIGVIINKRFIRDGVS